MVFNMRLERCSQRNQGGFGSFLQYQSFMWTAVCGLFHEHIEAVFIFAGDPQDHRLVATQQWVSSFSTLTRDKVSRSLWMSAHRRTASISWPEPVWHWSSPCSMPLCRIWSCFGAKLSNFGSASLASYVDTFGQFPRRFTAQSLVHSGFGALVGVLQLD